MLPDGHELWQYAEGQNTSSRLSEVARWRRVPWATRDASLSRACSSAQAMVRKSDVSDIELDGLKEIPAS